MYRGFVPYEGEGLIRKFETHQVGCPRCGAVLDLQINSLRRVIYCRKCGFDYEEQVEGDRFGDGI